MSEGERVTLQMDENNCVTGVGPAIGYEVAIRKNSTGETRKYQVDLEWHESSLFWWTEGNFGCDCNRGTEFLRAGGEPTDDYEHVCGDTKYSVLWARFPNGEEITIDGDGE